MMPISQMDAMIDFQIACDNGMDPQAAIQDDISARQAELEETQAEIVAALQERTEQVTGMISVLAQDVLGTDPMSAARLQVENLTRSLRDLKITRDRSLGVLQKAKSHQQQVTEENKALEKKLKDLKKAKEQGRYSNDRLFNFLEGVGSRGSKQIAARKEDL